MDDDSRPVRVPQFRTPAAPGVRARSGRGWHPGRGGRGHSLFHYRNHGSDYGRVLAGIQVPPAERAEFIRHRDELHYGYVEQTENPAYRMFLGS